MSTNNGTFFELSPEFSNIDSEIFEFNRTFLTYSFSTMNLHGYDLILSKIKDLRNKLLGLEPRSDFEFLFRKHNLDAFYTQEKVAEYLTKGIGDTFDVLDLIYGDGSYKKLEEFLRKYNWSPEWDHGRKVIDRRLKEIEASDEKAQAKIKEMIPKIKESVLEFSKARGYIPKDFDVRIYLIPIASELRRTSFQTDLNRLNLTSNEFIVTDEGGEIKVNPLYVFRAMFHEGLGHGVQTYNSSRLPRTLTMLSPNSSNVLNRSVQEGYASVIEEVTTDFLNVKGPDFGLTDEDLEIENLASKAMTEAHTSMSLHPILKEREIREKGFDLFDYVTRLTGNFSLASKMKREPKGSIEVALTEFGYYFGRDLVNEVREKMRRISNRSTDELKILTALSTGRWSRTVYEDATEYIFQNLGQN